MFSRILLGAVSVAGAIFVSAIAAAGPDDDPSADTASSPLPELTVAPPTDYPDVRLGNGSSSGQGAAFNPVDPKRLVVGIGSGTGCYVKASANGGRTWGAIVQVPVGDYCNEAPALAYTADGGRLYAAHLVYRSMEYVILVSMSTDQDATWSTPTIAMADGDCDSLYCQGYHGVRIAAAPDGRWIYVTTHLYYGPHDGYSSAYIVFTRSDDRGLTWFPADVIAGGSSLFFSPPLLSSALAAGGSGRVLIAYGWQDDDHPPYTLQVAKSLDHGASFDRQVVIADQSETDGLSGTDIRIDRFGTAHLVYQKGSSNSGGSAILYKTSRSPYLSWSAAPVRLDVNGANPSTPLLAIGACGQTSVLHATWVESRMIFYARKLAQAGRRWSHPVKLSRRRSDTAGYSQGSLAAAGPKAFSVFAGETGTSLESLFGSRVSSGVSCP